MRVVLAEDLFLLRDGLIRLLEAYDFEIAAAVDNGPELARALVTVKPDVAVVDVRLPPTFTDEGLQAALHARREVPGLPELVAEGRSNVAIAQRLGVTERAIAKHTSNIFLKLDLPPSDDDNRRVLAVLAYLNGS